MFKLCSGSLKLNLFSRRGYKTVVGPIKEAAKEIKEGKIAKTAEQIFVEDRTFSNRLKLMIYLIPFTTGVYFIYRGLWFDYLTLNKRKSLNTVTYAGLGFGAMMTGALAGNFLSTLKGRRGGLFNNSNIKGPLRLNALALHFLCFSLTGELLDRNLFFWGSGILASFGLMGNFLLFMDGARNGVLSFTIINSFQMPCALFILFSIMFFFSIYKERSREMALITEYKQREKFVNHLSF